ncbi:MAG: 2-keto-gluconate dehydrogenase [Sphingobacteriales bacterium 41-5]|nr:MAG: 2-keto-gluconate dehydrogenase [Sphingobacteriales bacterium 41-5]
MKYDLVVVGTGFASTFFLKKYLQKNTNKKILILERGHFVPHTERMKIKRGIASDYEKLFENYKDAYINNTPHKAWMFSTGFGGSSNCWWGCTPRFMPSDFKLKSLYGVENDWPLEYADLEPYYEEIEEAMAMSGPAETMFPRKNKYPQPPHLLAPPDKILNEKYGKQYTSQPTARARQATGKRNQCIASSICDSCPVDAKFTIENSGIDVYKNDAVEVVYGAQVYSLSTLADEAHKINFIKDGKEESAEADVFILGANPLFNTNILLHSGDKNPLTGKGFGEQLGIQAVIDLKDLSNRGGSTWVNANGYMLYDGDHRKEHAACLIETNNAPYIRLEKDKWFNVMSFRLVFEDLPQAGNYITTTNNKLIPQVFYNAGRSQYALKAFEEAKRKLPSILDVLPVEKIKYRQAFETEGHILGGTRMGETAQDSVVNKYSVHHQIKNIIVLGASTFTTYSASNPTLTVAALAMLAADKNF